jgi:TonB family protein
VDRSRAVSHRYNDSTFSRIQFIWNPNAIKGYIAAVVGLLITVFLGECSRYEPPEPINLRETVPVTLLVFGEGDGTGARKGNLSAEGAAMKGREATSALADAARAQSASGRNPAQDPTQSRNLRAAGDVGSKAREHQDATAAEMTIGSRDGAEDASGLGLAGSGRGKGLGWGDVDWGGGGNRIALKKVEPKFPAGAMSTRVKLRFRVQPDGSVSRVLPVQRSGDPAVDDAAMKALYQWRFNRLTTQQEMEGVITIVFKRN